MFTFKQRKIGKNLQSTCWYGSLFMNIYVLRPNELDELDVIKEKQAELAKEKVKKSLD